MPDNQTNSPEEWMVEAIAEYHKVAHLSNPKKNPGLAAFIARHHQEGCINFEAHMQAAEMEQAVQELLAATM